MALIKFLAQLLWFGLYFTTFLIQPFYSNINAVKLLLLYSDDLSLFSENSILAIFTIFTIISNLDVLSIISLKQPQSLLGLFNLLLIYF